MVKIFSVSPFIYKDEKNLAESVHCCPIPSVVYSGLLYFLQILVWIQHKAFVDLKMFRFFISNLL